MDLMGSDALQSEDAMRQMWGDSMKAVKCQRAHITYDDFLLLMKGQTKEAAILASPVTEREVVSHKLRNRPLEIVPEVSPAIEGDDSTDKEDIGATVYPQKVAMENMDQLLLDGSNHTPRRLTNAQPQSAPTTPADHKRILDLDYGDTPLSMDDDEDILSSGPGVPGTAASLTPPHSPVRGADDYITPMGGRRTTIELTAGSSKVNEDLMLPGFSTDDSGMYTRRRSRSVGDEEKESAGNDKGDLHAVADAVRDMLLPETDHAHTKELDALVKDKTKSALVVNRKLYRAHRQMRLAVLDASKRFEEQQARHAREVILAARETEEDEKGLGMIKAGLVMRHGQKKQVSSEAIRKVLEENQAQQQALVEKANRRGGRGRRSRKKTISDMSSMLTTSMGQDEMGVIANNAVGSAETTSPPSIVEDKSAEHGMDAEQLPVPGLPNLTPSQGQMRGATVPGEFRKTHDPFSITGRYGAVAAYNDSNEK